MYRALIVLGAVALHAVPAHAHHSFAMFDADRTVTLKGTVKEFRWNNPHVFIELRVPATAGEEEWSIEMASPLHLMRNGWKPGSLRSGDKVVIVVHPMRDGSHGGNYVSATAADGSPVGGPGSKQGAGSGA